MAGTYEVHETTKGNDLNAPMDEKGYVTGKAIRTFTVMLDVGTGDDAVTVEANAQLPRRGDAHPSGSALRVDNVRVGRVSAIFYTAVISYSSPRRKKDEDDNLEPWQLAAKVEWTSVDSEEGVSYDADGEPLVNIGTNEMIEGVTIPISDIAATITKNFLLFDPKQIYRFKNKVSADGFLGFPPGEAKVEHVQSNPQEGAELPYWEVVVRVLFREPFLDGDSEQAWYRRILHRGDHAMYGGSVVNGKLINAKKQRARLPGDKTDAVTPLLLDQYGRVLEEDAEPFWLYKKMFKTTNLNDMGLF